MIVRAIGRMLLILGLVACGTGHQMVIAESLWDMKSLSKAPATYPAPDSQPTGAACRFYDGILNKPELRAVDSGTVVKSLYFDGPDYHGRKTRVFAFYGVPAEAAKHKVPGVVLVHGGGGTAFESWVRLWCARGYAAIAIDTCGCHPAPEPVHQVRSSDGGPDFSNIFGCEPVPAKDQWPYHAVAGTILAHSLLISMPEVDKNRTGVIGISWGSFIVCTASSLDKRFKFAVSTYGCGFIGDNSAWLDDFAKMGKDAARQWLDRWDPSSYLAMSRVPRLWITGSNDFAYPMDSLQKSYRLARGPQTLCIRTDMLHGHGGPGENPEEIRAFADSICKGGKPLIHITGQGRDGSSAWVSYDGPTRPTSAVLELTSDTGRWQERHWQSVPCKILAGKVTGQLPTEARVYFLNLTDERGFLVSSRYEENPDVRSAGDRK